MLAQLFVCPNCGDVWNVKAEEIFDGDDNCETYWCCQKCGSMDLEEKKSPEGLPCLHPLSDEEIFWLTSQENEDDV